MLILKHLISAVYKTWLNFISKRILKFDDQGTHMISVRKYEETKEFIDSFLAPLQILQNIMNHI